MSGVDEPLHDRALALTHGHPLALALLGDVLAQDREAAPLDLAAAPDGVRPLLERFVAGVPSTRHRDALHVAVHAQFTTEALLNDALGSDDVPALFAWLRGLSFVEEGPHGLFPHDLARDVLDADLRWRDPDAYADLHQRVRTHVRRRITQSEGPAQRLAASDLVFLHRGNSLSARFGTGRPSGAATSTHYGRGTIAPSSR